MLESKTTSREEEGSIDFHLESLPKAWDEGMGYFISSGEVSARVS